MRASRGAVSWGHCPGACPDPMLIRRTSCSRGRDCAVSQFQLGSALQGRPTSCMMSGGIVQARKDAASRLECLHVQAAVMRLAGHESVLMLHTKCSRCPKPNTSRRRAGCIIAAANGQSSRDRDLRASGKARRREDLRASQNKTRGYRCGSTGSRKGLNQRKWKAVRLGCLAAHGEQMDEKRS